VGAAPLGRCCDDDEVNASVERFAKGLTGRLSSPIKNGIRYEFKLALDWTLYMRDPRK
jgi:hypothetical protein